jgi:alanyl-tRNA synthetase
VLLATESDGKVSLIAGVTKDLTDRFKAGDLVKAAAEKVGGAAAVGRTWPRPAARPGRIPAKALELVALGAERSRAS